MELAAKPVTTVHVCVWTFLNVNPLGTFKETSEQIPDMFSAIKSAIVDRKFGYETGRFWRDLRTSAGMFEATKTGILRPKRDVFPVFYLP